MCKTHTRIRVHIRVCKPCNVLAARKYVRASMVKGYTSCGFRSLSTYSDSILSFLCFRVKYFSYWWIFYFFLVNLAGDFVLSSNIDDQLDSCTWWSTLECLGNVIFGIPHGHFFDFGAEFFFSVRNFWVHHSIVRNKKNHSGAPFSVVFSRLSSTRKRKKTGCAQVAGKKFPEHEVKNSARPADLLVRNPKKEIPKHSIENGASKTKKHAPFSTSKSKRRKPKTSFFIYCCEHRRLLFSILQHM